MQLGTIFENKAAWKVLETFDKPFITAFSDGDPVTRGGEKQFQDRVVGAKGRPHVTIEGAGHFLQEDKPDEIVALAAVLYAESGDPAAPTSPWRRAPLRLEIDGENFTLNVRRDGRKWTTTMAEGSTTLGLLSRDAGLNPRMIIPVDLFGLPADFVSINALAAAEALFVLDDAAQGFGATVGNRKVGTLADATATSFFLAKPLGCYGDGGAVFTDDDDMRDILVSLRTHGQGADRYDNVRIGLTARLDTIQAAVLIEKLKIFPEEIAERNRIARRYSQHLADVVRVPTVPPHMTSVWAQYTIRVNAGSRDAFAAALKAQGIPTAIYYPKPLHRLEAYRHFPADPCGLPVCDLMAEEVISLPMHAYLDETTQDRIIAAVRRAVSG